MALTQIEQGHTVGKLSYMQSEFALPDGKLLGLNKNRVYEQPFYLMPNPPFNQVAMAALQPSAPQIITVSGEGPMQITHLACERTRQCKISLQIEDGNRTRKLMKAGLHVDTVLGTGALPYLLPEALYIDELHHLVVVFTDISGNPNNIRLTLLGSKYCQLQDDPRLARIKTRLKAGSYLSIPYWETIERGSIDLAVGASGQGMFEINNDQHFELHQMSVAVVRTDTNTLVTGELFTFDAVDLARGESLINAPNGTHYQISNALVFGDNNYPYRLHEPWTIYSGQRIICSFTNISTLPLRIFPTFGGIALNNGLQGR